MNSVRQLKSQQTKGQTTSASYNPNDNYQQHQHQTAPGNRRWQADGRQHQTSRFNDSENKTRPMSFNQSPSGSHSTATTGSSRPSSSASGIFGGAGNSLMTSETTGNDSSQSISSSYNNNNINNNGNNINKKPESSCGSKSITPTVASSQCRICRKLISEDESYHLCCNCNQFICEDCASYSSTDQVSKSSLSIGHNRIIGYHSFNCNLSLEHDDRCFE